MLRLNYCFLFVLFFLSAQSEANSGKLVVKAGAWNFATNNVAAEDSAVSGIGAYAFEGSYSFIPHISFVFGFNLIMSEIFSGSSGYGFDVGMRYFPFSEVGNRSVLAGGSQINIRQVWRPYVGLAMRQRLFGLAISTSYLGPGMSLGLEYSLSQKWFLTGEARYDLLYGQDSAVVNQTNILFGVGLEF
jgi:hypothetical protein